MAQNLTAADAEKLREYLRKLDDLAKKEPDMLPAVVWDKVWPKIQATGEIPAEYRDRIAESTRTDEATGETQVGYIDVVWERWNSELTQLDAEYHDVIIKALRYALRNKDEAETTQPIIDLIESIIGDEADRMTPEQVKAIITNNLFTSPYLPMLNGAPANDVMQLSIKGMTPDSFSKKAVFKTKDGHKITIEHFDKLQGVLSTSAKKIIDTALLYLTTNNYYRTGKSGLSPIVEIPLIEYGEACGYQLTPKTMPTAEEQTAENRRIQERIKELKKNLRRDLHDIGDIVWAGEDTKGRKKGDYKELRLISSHGIRNGVIQINFDVEAAAYFVKSYVMQYPTALLKHDNRKPNAYAIGRKIAFHNSLDHNANAGTNSTLSVKSLLADAPEIPTYEEIKARGQRNWKDKIKKPLEIALDENINVELISRWEYRDPATGATYTADEAQPLTWPQYSRLMVDFIMVDPPDQTGRRAARLEEKAAAEAEKPRRKRGRPRTKKENCGGK